jgi:hypothetical protein
LDNSDVESAVSRQSDKLWASHYVRSC